ncbi:uncharacterized protein LOC107871786 [Capsicum annuum]|uniref:uncharacterized protein LOC107871786 n=1 Tax=Capsicum annuum TaxID=4072 RepID=UPI0007BF7D2F|nr:uncharacterized protein LOC107871786 [Capsicum annuum]
MDELRQAQAKKFQEALDMGEIETCKGLNQELGLARAANTHWGSHYKSFKNFISIFGSITDVLNTIVVDSESVEEKARATGYLKTCQTFEILRMAELYPDDFGENIMVTLKNQIETYIVGESFFNLKGLGDLSEELVKKKKYFNYPLVFRLVKFPLLLPIATATVEKGNKIDQE